MSTQAWIILTAVESAAAQTLDDDQRRLGAREVDNPLADALGVGELTGRFVAPARLLADPDYAAWRSLLEGLPVFELENAALFLSADPD